MTNQVFNTNRATIAEALNQRMVTIMQQRPLTPEKYYRLPWNLSDNAITWLEPTTKCNLYCEGCYRENDPKGHKPLEDVIKDLEQVKHLRRTDGISIAGGEPLIYPHIVDLVKYVADQGWKPIINSNGQALTPELVRDLTKAGLVGFTMHVDSHQVRPGWKGKTEEELCELREKLMLMIHEHGRGKVACAFNATIYRDTLDDIPMLTRWAHKNIKYVNTMVYILFRTAKDEDRFVNIVNGHQATDRGLVYQLEHRKDHVDILAQETVNKIREAYPDYEPCAYLNGTEDPRAMKWLLGLRAGNNKKILGHMNPRFIEFLQTAHHLFYGSYLAYTRPKGAKNLQLTFPISFLNRGLLKVFWNWLKSPTSWFKNVRVQSIMVIQPCDVFNDGRQSMCDGCPDAIYYKGRMVWSCRVDELEKYGNWIQCIPVEDYERMGKEMEAERDKAEAEAKEPAEADAN